MSQHFIEDIKIENFKCFENLEINDFKRVNVFGGKNNVGKTALLEAIELLVKSFDPLSLANNLYSLLKRRQTNNRIVVLDVFGEFSDNFLIKSGVKKINVKENVDIQFNSVEQLFPGIFFSVRNYGNNKELTFPLSKFIINAIERPSKISLNEKNTSTVFVSSLKNDDIICILYGAVVELDKEDFLNESLNMFDQSIISFKAIPDKDGVTPKFKIKERAKLVSLSEMGDGISRYVTILCAIWASQNGFLFIDEIENGIHYSNYKKLWELIFMASEQANCQVFVTTHSKECITAFNEVQQEHNDDAGRYFELFKSPKKQRIMAAVRDAEQLQYALENDKEIRGE